MSHYLKHEPCPRCGSKDNLARYSDGSAWCFGCRYRERPDTSIARLSQRFVPANESSLGIVVPSDLTTIIPAEPLAWLYSYQLTKQEITQYDFYYSPSNSGLCSLCRDSLLPDVPIVGYILRYFPRKDRKYLIQGNKLRMSMSMLRNRDTSLPLFFCEDYISAIKISRHFPCVPLFGTYVPLELIIWASKTFKSFRLWLDPDKRKESVIQCLNLKQKGYDIRPVFSEVDPKEVSDYGISSILSSNGNLL